MSHIFPYIYAGARVCVCIWQMVEYIFLRALQVKHGNGNSSSSFYLFSSQSPRTFIHCMKCACIVLCTHEFCIYFDHFTVNCTLNRWYTLFLSIRINYHRRNNIAWENRENGTARDVSYIYSFIYLRVEWTSWTLRFVLRFLFSLSISYLSASPILLASLNIKINKWLLPWILHQFKVDFGSFQPI